MKKDEVKNVAISNKEFLYFYLLIHMNVDLCPYYSQRRTRDKGLQDNGADDNAWTRDTGRSRSLEEVM